MRSSRFLSFFVALPSAAAAYDFSVDPASPEVAALRYEARDVVLQDGSGVHIAGTLLGLGSDELDGFSYGKDLLRPVGLPNFFVSLQFSVDRATVGSGSAITTQATGNGAAGDKFDLLVLRSGRTVGPFLDSDAPSHQLTPKPSLESSIDGLSWPPGTRNHVYYTVARGGSRPPADVFYVAEPGVTAPVVYATAAQLGLVAGDDVDALAIKDGGGVGVLDANDVVYVSLDAASPTRAAVTGGSEVILQVFPQPMRVVFTASQLGLGAAASEEVDAITGYDPGPPLLALFTSVASPSSHLSGEFSFTGPTTGFYTAIAGGTGYYGTVSPKLTFTLGGTFAWDPDEEEDSDLHTVKEFPGLMGAGPYAWDRATALIDLTTGRQSANWFGWSGFGYVRELVIDEGDFIPGTTLVSGGFGRCQAFVVGDRPCFGATFFVNPGFQPRWSAICRDAGGAWSLGATFLAPGAAVNGKTVGSLQTFDCAVSLQDAGLTQCYGTARSLGFEPLLLRVGATLVGGQPTWGTPQIVGDAATAAPGGGTFNDYGFQMAAQSAAFHGRTSLGREGIYRFDGAAYHRIADTTTPVPGGSGSFTGFGDDLSNDAGAVTFVGNTGAARGVYSTLTGRLQKIARAGDVVDGRTLADVTLARDAATANFVSFGARFDDGRSAVVVKALPVPFDTSDATQRPIHVDVELDPDPSILGPDPRALLVGDLGTARLRGTWSSNGTTGTVTIPGSEVARLLALQFGAAASAIGSWTATVDVATGAVSSSASGVLASAPFAFDGDTAGGPWTSPLLGAIPGSTAGFETDGAGRKRFCSNAFSQIAGGACGAGAFGFPAAAPYDRTSGFVHQTGPLTLGDVVLWGFLGDQRWLEAPPADVCPDADADGVCDADDNCPFEPNPGQEDQGGISLASGPDGVGDACQCGDHNGDGRVTLADAVILQRSFLVPPTAARSQARCDVGGSAGCSLADAVVLRRTLVATATIAQQCDAALP